MHIGNLRTALYAYLLAKSNNGTFILRIEDTDRERLVEGTVQVIYDTLEQAKLRYDEGPNVGGEHGPYVQSERKDIYLEYAQKLVLSGHAYYCFCDKERLDTLHETKGNVGYDRHCRNLSEAEVNDKLNAGVPYVIRQKVPLEDSTTYHDAVFGEISINNAEMQDTVLMKADHYPTYNFANVVDDYLMGITHVVRGSEYVTSTPLYILLYKSFGWECPEYVHLPLIMGKNSDGSVSKLSKRHGAVSFQDLVSDGYLPETIINYIALLGWSPKETNEEFFTLEELAQIFRVEDINKSPAVFDYDKLLWFNGAYIRKLAPERFSELAMPYLQQVITKAVDIDKILTLIQPRVEKLSHIPEIVTFLETLPEFDCEMFLNKKNKVTLATTKVILPALIELLKDLKNWNNDYLFEQLKTLADSLEVKSGTVMWITRIAISGTLSTPGGATDILEILGKDESLL
ncbi:MAG: glutamate--tRNA ligase, partial [Gorillibacterium sp.]|nr:glutamate--tRNA ligase [Gorillibacterium sp.]